MTLFGIKNCNTVKAAVDWLNQHGVAFAFHDYKKSGVSAAQLSAWCDQVGWERLVNKRGTTWRQLPEDTQRKVVDAPSAIALMMEKPSVIKRPLIEDKQRVLLLGFDAPEYEKVFG